MLDRLVLMTGVVGPLMNLPQIVKTLQTRDAGDLSLFSWVAYTLYDIPWIFYGVVHKDHAIVVAYSFWLLSNVLVLLGVIFYGG